MPPMAERAARRESLALSPVRELRGRLVLPGSKSLSIRVLLLAALAHGETRIDGLLDSDDTAVMIESLGRLGVAVVRDGAGRLGGARVTGAPQAFARRSAELFVGNSGLTIRTLVPAVAAALDAVDSAGIEIAFTGVPRMLERPIGDLVDGLRAVGASIRYTGRDGYPPLVVEGRSGTPRLARELRVSGATSSQFVTGLLQAAPLLATRGDVRIRVEGELISRPYVEMTIALLARFGVEVEREAGDAYRIARGATLRSPGTIAVEGDASSASYFLAAGALAGGPVRVIGAGRRSVQGDVAFADALEQMGARIERGDDWIEASAPPGRLVGIDLDCNAIPDAAMTLAVCAAFARGSTILRNIGSWRVKETDRIAAMSSELERLGVATLAGDDWLRIDPPAALRGGASIRTYDDHRVAMCFALASLGAGGVPLTILDPDCVAKTFPDYFERLAELACPS